MFRTFKRFFIQAASIYAALCIAEYGAAGVAL